MTRTATKSPPISDHADAVRTREQVRARHQAEYDQAEAAYNDAMREFDKWHEPARKLVAARERLTALVYVGTRDIDKAEAHVRNAADPLLAKEIRRLEQEQMVIGSLFKSWAEPGLPGQPPAVGSNAAECDAYRLSCVASVNALRAFQQQPHDAESAQMKIRELRAESAPRPST